MTAEEKVNALLQEYGLYEEEDDEEDEKFNDPTNPNSMNQFFNNNNINPATGQYDPVYAQQQRQKKKMEKLN